MAYVVTTYERGYFEAHLGAIYSALEGLVDHLSEVHEIGDLFGSSAFKRVTKKIRALLEDELSGEKHAQTLTDEIEKLVDTTVADSATAESLSTKIAELVQGELSDDDLVEAVKKKIPELKRRAFIDRLALLLAKYELDTVRRWNSPRPVLDDLQGVVKRRDIYIHQGKVDSDHHVGDYVMLRGFLELWILKLLDCPPDAVDSHAFYNSLILPT